MLSTEGTRHLHRALPALEPSPVVLLPGGKVGPHARFETAWKRDGAVLVGFPVVDVENSPVQIEALTRRRTRASSA